MIDNMDKESPEEDSTETPDTETVESQVQAICDAMSPEEQKIACDYLMTKTDPKNPKNMPDINLESDEL